MVSRIPNGYPKHIRLAPSVPTMWCHTTIPLTCHKKSTTVPKQAANQLAKKSTNVTIKKLWPKGCVEKHTKKYTIRKPPPYPSQRCPGILAIGNDKRYWTSVPDKNGRHRWVPANAFKKHEKGEILVVHCIVKILVSYLSHRSPTLTKVIISLKDDRSHLVWCHNTYSLRFWIGDKRIQNCGDSQMRCVRRLVRKFADSSFSSSLSSSLSMTAVYESNPQFMDRRGQLSLVVSATFASRATCSVHSNMLRAH